MDLFSHTPKEDSNHKQRVYAVGAHGQVIGGTSGKQAIHIQYGMCTLTLSEAEFIDFSLMVEEASSKLHSTKPLVRLTKRT